MTRAIIVIQTWITSARRRADVRERGASLVEYALLLALIALVCIGALSFLGTSTSDSFSRDSLSLANAGN